MPNPSDNDPLQAVTILPFQREDQIEVRNLILAGLAEHWGTIVPGLNPDLNNIHLTYAHAVFLVARYQGRIVGTGALVPLSVDTARIVRMSVAADMRRKNVGTLVFRTLCDQARTLGIRHLVLETTASWQAAIAFYQHLGCQPSHHQDGNIYFFLDLVL
jgi:GNAT superfamily N-acetyltransferase